MEVVVKWEYRLETIGANGAMFESLEELGQRGWELVQAVRGNEIGFGLSLVLILKRPIAEPNFIAITGVECGPMAQLATSPQPEASDEKR